MALPLVVLGFGLLSVVGGVIRIVEAKRKHEREMAELDAITEATCASIRAVGERFRARAQASTTFVGADVEDMLKVRNIRLPGEPLN